MTNGSKKMTGITKAKKPKMSRMRVPHTLSFLMRKYVSGSLSRLKEKEEITNMT